jgi:RNA polymerase sigma-70 factor (ECF subfamily)
MNGFQATFDAIWRIEAPRLVARLTRLVGDLALAEDIAQDTFVTALGRWPTVGIPDNPGGWLWSAARQGAIDLFRRRDRQHDKYQALGVSPESVETDLERIVEERDIGDDLLGLVFMTCHPVLSPDARVALTLRSVGGLTTPEIAKAYLASEATIAQRIVRAKRTLTAAGVRFELPDHSQRRERLASVMEVIYLIFNEGYAAATGNRLTRADLCTEAMRLGRVLSGLVPADTEVLGLVALMELQASRLHARTGPRGEAILLADQDRTRWDRLLIQHGLRALERAETFGGGRGPYVLQAKIAACHARARTLDATDWVLMAATYDTLSLVAPSPIVEINRAVALGMAYGPAAGLTLADQLLDVSTLRSNYLLPAVRGDLLHRLGRHREACDEFARAAGLTGNDRERDTLLNRARDCADHDPGGCA